MNTAWKITGLGAFGAGLLTVAIIAWIMADPEPGGQTFAVVYPGTVGVIMIIVAVVLALWFWYDRRYPEPEPPMMSEEEALLLRSILDQARERGEL